MSELIHRNPDGSTEGADPRSLSRPMLNGAGHKKRPILKAIREKCLDCCNGNDAEVRKCTAVGCALWPYRMGTNPFNDRPGGKFPGNTAVPGQGDRPELGPPRDSQPRDQSPRVGLAAGVRARREAIAHG